MIHVSAFEAQQDEADCERDDRPNHEYRVAEGEVQKFFHGWQTLDIEVLYLREQPRELFRKATSFFYYRLDISGR